MDILVLNPNLEIIDVIDTYESLIWTERYNNYGDFELYTKLPNDLLSVLDTDNYLKIADSDRLMVIEDFQIKTDVENGSGLIVKGRSGESLLDRRIIWNQTVIDGDLQNGIKKLIDENLISPTDTDREIPKFIFDLTDDENITTLDATAQFTRKNLGESTIKLCQASSVGFRVIFDSENDTLRFQLYFGKDRSYSQLENPYVIFSKEFDNLINSDYSKNKSNLKTLTVVAGEGEGAARKLKIVGSGVGLARREMETDARDLSQTVDGVVISDAEYYAQLEQRGLEDLSENSTDDKFDCEVDTTSMFKYGVDFFLGDIIQIVSEYGVEAKARVKEIIRSKNTNGVSIYPTLEIIN